MNPVRLLLVDDNPAFIASAVRPDTGLMTVLTSSHGGGFVARRILPLVLLASVSAVLKMVTLWHFRWVRMSPLAATRRAAMAGKTSS